MDCSPHSTMKQDFVQVAPHPFLSLFIRNDHGVICCVVMTCCMLILGIITAAHIATCQTQPKMNPGITHRETIVASCCQGSLPSVATVISHPFGSQSPDVKAREAAVAVDDGACELDIVPHFGAILAERWDAVREELRPIRSASGDATLKLVIETGRLSSTQIREVCSIASDIGFEYVVNTVGFRLVSTDPDAEGSASVQVVRSLREITGDSLQIKAAGGITTLQAVKDLLEAGAHRVAVSMSPGLLRSMNWAS